MLRSMFRMIIIAAGVYGAWQLMIRIPYTWKLTSPQLAGVCFIVVLALVMLTKGIDGSD